MAQAHALRSTPRLDLYPPSVPARLVRGQEVSVYYNLHPACAWERHSRDQIEIALFFRAGTCRVGWDVAPGKREETEATGPHVCVIASGLAHDCRLAAETELLVLYVEQSLLRRIVRRKVRGVVISAIARHDVVIWLLASLLRHLCTNGLRPNARTIDAIGGELACWLVEILGQVSQPAATLRRRLTPSQQEKVMRYMQANMKHDIHVIDLAKQTGHSASHFTELFTATVGRSPYHYLKEMRLLKAYELLLTGDYLAKEAGLAVGYSNADHFSEVFHAFFGYSPRELLIRIRGSSAKPRP